MLDFIRVAAAVPDVAVGNAAENTDRIIEKAAEAENKSPQLTVFPELALTGYTCADLFFQQTLLRSAREGLKKIVSCSEAFSSVIAVGLPLEIHGALYNCAAVIYRGRLYGIVPKTYIPTYNEFYEKRWFTPGARLGSVSLTSAELGIGELQTESIPAGRDLIFDTGKVIDQAFHTHVLIGKRTGIPVDRYEEINTGFICLCCFLERCLINIRCPCVFHINSAFL